MSTTSNNAEDAPSRPGGSINIGPSDIIVGTLGAAAAILLLTFLATQVGLSTDSEIAAPVAIGFVIASVTLKRKLIKMAPRRRRSTLLGVPTMLILIAGSLATALGLSAFAGRMGQHVDEGMYAMLFYGWQKGGSVILVGGGLLVAGTLLHHFVLTAPIDAP